MNRLNTDFLGATHDVAVGLDRTHNQVVTFDSYQRREVCLSPTEARELGQMLIDGANELEPASAVKAKGRRK